MELYELQMIISIMVLTPFAAIGIFKIFNFFKDLYLVRKGNVETGFFTQNRGFRLGWGKPDGEMLKDGKKAYQYNPKKLYRHGGKPIALYNESAIHQLDPLNEADSKLNTERLSEIQIRWFNLGKIAGMKNEQVMKVLLIIAVAGAVAAAGLGIINMQGQSMMEGRLANALSALDAKVTPAPIVSNDTGNATVVIR